MPTYDYICKSCGKEFEAFQSMSHDAFTHCPQEVCEQTEKGKGEVVRKIGGGAGLIFNGSGFYITDYKGSSSTPAQQTSTTSGTSAPTTSGTSTPTSSSAE